MASLLAQRDAFSNWAQFAAANSISGWSAEQPDYCGWTGVVCNNRTRAIEEL